MKPTPLILSLITGLLILGAAAGGGCNYGPGSSGEQSTPERVVEAFIAAFQEKKPETMAGLFLNGQLNPEEEEFLLELATVIEIEDFQVDEVFHLSAEEAEVKTTLNLVIYNRKKAMQATYRVTKKDRRWYLLKQL